MDVVSLVSSSNRLITLRFRVLGLLGTCIYLLHPGSVSRVHFFSILRLLQLSYSSILLWTATRAGIMHRSMLAGINFQISPPIVSRLLGIPCIIQVSLRCELSKKTKLRAA